MTIETTNHQAKEKVAMFDFRYIFSGTFFENWREYLQKKILRNSCVVWKLVTNNTNSSEHFHANNF